MDTPATQAGRILLHEHSSGTPHMARHILAIEREASASATALLRADFAKRINEAIGGEVANRVLGMFDWALQSALAAQPEADAVTSSGHAAGSAERKGQDAIDLLTGKRIEPFED